MPESALTRSKHDPPAFADFYRAEAGSLTRYFARRVADPEAALDLTAETFAQAYGSRRRFRGTSEEAARGWLYAIAQRQLSRYLRRGYADREACAKLGLERPAAGAEELLRVEDLGGMGDLRRLLAQELHDLPSGYREAVRLRVVEELPYVEVAKRLAITESAARMRVSRALSHLRSELPQQLAPEGLS